MIMGVGDLTILTCLKLSWHELTNGMRERLTQ